MAHCGKARTGGILATKKETGLYCTCGQKRAQSHPFSCTNARTHSSYSLCKKTQRQQAPKEILWPLEGALIFAEWAPATGFFKNESGYKRNKKELKVGTSLYICIQSKIPFNPCQEKRQRKSWIHSIKSWKLRQRKNSNNTTSSTCSPKIWPAWTSSRLHPIHHNNIRTPSAYDRPIFIVYLGFRATIAFEMRQRQAETTAPTNTLSMECTKINSVCTWASTDNSAPVGSFLADAVMEEMRLMEAIREEVKKLHKAFPTECIDVPALEWPELESSRLFAGVSLLANAEVDGFEQGFSTLNICPGVFGSFYR